MSDEPNQASAAEIGVFMFILACSAIWLADQVIDLPVLLLLVALIGVIAGVVVLMTLSVARARRSEVSWPRAIGQAVWGGLRLLVSMLF